jgi:hypothetical protein
LVYIGACAIFASRVELQGKIAHSLFVVFNLELLFGRVQIDLWPSGASRRALFASKHRYGIDIESGLSGISRTIGKVIQNQQTEDGAKAK